MITESQATFLRRLTIGDPRGIEQVLAEVGDDGLGLTCAQHQARIAALIAMGAPIATFQREVNAALSAGVTEDEITDLLPALAALVGTVAVMTVAPRLALTLGYDVDADLETLGPRPPR
jgi:4-carboxymuconolactone decarboxylase